MEEGEARSPATSASIISRRCVLFIGVRMVEIAGKGMNHVGVMTSLPVDLIAAGAPCENIEVLVCIKRDMILDRFLADRL